MERLAVQADALLLEEDRAARGELDEQRRPPASSGSSTSSATRRRDDVEQALDAIWTGLCSTSSVVQVAVGDRLAVDGARAVEAEAVARAARTGRRSARRA